MSKEHNLCYACAQQELCRAVQERMKHKLGATLALKACRSGPGFELVLCLPGEVRNKSWRGGTPGSSALSQSMEPSYHIADQVQE